MDLILCATKAPQRLHRGAGNPQIRTLELASKYSTDKRTVERADADEGQLLEKYSARNMAEPAKAILPKIPLCLLVCRTGFISPVRDKLSYGVT
jgi:hypothetical protein